MSRTQTPDFQTIPSAVIWDGKLTAIPLFAVSRITLTEQYRLPQLGSSGYRAAVESSDDTMSISGLLIGPGRYLWKQGLELLADSTRRGGGGAIVVTAMALRLDMQVTNLTFTSSTQRRDTLEVSISLQHVPRPNPLGPLLELGGAAAMTMVEFLT